MLLRIVTDGLVLHLVPQRGLLFRKFKQAGHLFVSMLRVSRQIPEL